MSWQAVARKDFQDAVRSRWLLGLTVLFVLLVSLTAYVMKALFQQAVTSNDLLNMTNGIVVTTLIPLIALIIAYGSVVGERDTGSVKLLLSLPHSRADVVFGKVIGRAAAIAVPVILGFIVPGIVLLFIAQTFNIGHYVGYTLMAAFLGVVFVAIAVGFSASTSSNRLAILGAIAVYFIFIPLWGVVKLPLQLYFAFSGVPSWLPLSGTQIINFLTLINPTGAFKIVSSSFLAGQLFTGKNVSLQVAAVVMLFGWLLLPPLLGLWKFQTDDL